MSTRRKRGIATAAAAATGLVAAMSINGSATATPTESATPSRAQQEPPGSPPAGDPHDHLPDIDTRPDTAPPSAAQKSAAPTLTKAAGKDSGSPAAQVTWNRFGSVESVTPSGTAPLATGLGSDPEKAARTYLERNAAAFGLSAADVSNMEHVTTNRVGKASVVMLRQTVGGISAGLDGMVVVAVEKGQAKYLNSSLAPLRGKAAQRRSAATLTPEEALGKAATNVGASASKISRVASTRSASSGDWTRLKASGLVGEQHVQRVVVPVPGAATRDAYHVVVRDADDSGYSVHIDAQDGSVIARESLVDFDSDDPRWKVFTGTPAHDGSSEDSRVEWCWTAECTESVKNPASPLAWDVDPVTEESTTTTSGNNAYTGERWTGAGAVNPAPLTPDRNYTFPWTNQWFTNKCNPANYASDERNDISAATTNLFAMHNRMHDWSYNLGFTETAWNMQRDNGTKGGVGGDPELGYAQSGAKTGSRNNANQGTPPDGISGYSNMYLWQPQAGGFYAPCVDGDYDMSVIGHEYGHAISNRMAGGPNAGLSGLQAGAMGESWSDLMATEYLQEMGYAPVGSTATPMGSYVTGNPDRGIRNYNFSDSPLNYSNVGYDLTGPQVHADGEIWSATQSDIRADFIERHGKGDAATQRSCAEGKTEVSECPGNRQWMQLVFDAWLLMPSGSVSMVDARNAMLAADLLRFGGANQDILWDGFAARGLGEGAASDGASDDDPTPSFTSAHSDSATLRLTPTGEDGRPVAGAKVFVGEYAARSTAVADTDDDSDLGDSFEIVPGEQTYTVTAPGKAQTQVTFEARPGQTRDLRVRMRDNLADTSSGATVTGEGTDIPAVADGDEGTTAATVEEPTAEQKVLTVDLAGGRQTIRRMQVSALPDPEAGINRFQNLRRFRVLTCDARNAVTCDEDRDYRTVYTSPEDAFPGEAPRPVAPELKMRDFDIPRTRATHVRVELLTNQCQGGPAFAGEQDEDPDNETDCATGYDGADTIALSEVQILRR
ncbi:MAG TPA: M36 family metallopeptidase [Candidatus Janibacter merdipullorum]|nr:M36 family metallopeptidase [Candidatus Janibacter merdipullorum]